MASAVKSRVVITGMGPVSACGTGVDIFWDALVKGESGIGPITLFDAAAFEATMAGEVRNFDLTQFVTPSTPLRRLARQTQLALAATWLALEDANLNNGQRQQFKGHIPVYLGISTSAYGMVEQAAGQLIQKGPGRVSPHSSTSSLPHQAASVIAAEFGLTASAQTLSSACPAGLDAIGQAAQLIRSGKTDIALAGGADAPVCALGIACLQQSGLVSRSKSPGGPFNQGNDSGVISEGAGMLVLQSMDSALAQGAKIYAEVISYASSVDLNHEDATIGLGNAIAQALNDAGICPSDIDYICAHGSGHPALDRAEIRIIKKLFEAHAYKVPISSIKGAVGNALAAAGPLQTIASALALSRNTIPPTANLHNLDPVHDLDIVFGRARHHCANRILINAHGLGGGNSVLIIQRATPP